MASTSTCSVTIWSLAGWLWLAAAYLFEREERRALRPVCASRLERRLLPLPRSGSAVADDGPEDVVAVLEDRGAHLARLADDALMHTPSSSPHGMPTRSSADRSSSASPSQSSSSALQRSGTYSYSLPPGSVEQRVVTPLEKALRMAEFNRKKKKHESLVARMLPHKAQSVD